LGAARPSKHAYPLLAVNGHIHPNIFNGLQKESVIGSGCHVKRNTTYIVIRRRQHFAMLMSPWVWPVPRAGVTVCGKTSHRQRGEGREEQTMWARERKKKRGGSGGGTGKRKARHCCSVKWENALELAVLAID